MHVVKSGFGLGYGCTVTVIANAELAYFGLSLFFGTVEV